MFANLLYIYVYNNKLHYNLFIIYRQINSDSYYNKDIILELIKFNIGTRKEIIAAMNSVVNKNDNNEKKQINLINNNHNNVN